MKPYKGLDIPVVDVDFKILLEKWKNIEEYYRQTDPRKMKKRYKTIPGLICALKLKSIYWIVRNGFISEEKSLRIARQYLGRHYNRTTIYNVFSRRKSMFSYTG